MSSMFGRKYWLIKNDRVSRRFDLQSQCSFITRTHHELIRNTGFDEDLASFLSTSTATTRVWDAISVVSRGSSSLNTTASSGTIRFNADQADFQRPRLTFLNLYYGCSLSALAHLARRRVPLVGSSLPGTMRSSCGMISLGRSRK